MSRLTAACFVLVLVGCIRAQLSHSTEWEIVRKTRSKRISCNVDDAFSLSSYALHWYRQRPGEGLRRILYFGAGSSTPTAEADFSSRFNGAKKEQTTSLTITNARDEDTATYYCALWKDGTVTQRLRTSAQIPRFPDTAYLQPQTVWQKSVYALLFTLTAVVSGLRLEQNDFLLTRQERKSVYIHCKVTGLSSSYVHWYQKTDDEALRRILYISSSGQSAVRDTGHPDSKDFDVKKDPTDPNVYNLKIESLKKRHTGVYYCAAWDSSHSDSNYTTCWCVHSTPPSEVDDHLLGLANIEGEVVSSAPLCEHPHFLPVQPLIIVGDSADYCDVVGKLDEAVYALLFTLTAVVSGLRLEQNDFLLTRQERKSVYIHCKVTDLTTTYVHWYQKTDDEALRRILYISSSGQLVPDTGHPNHKDFIVKKDPTDPNVYNLRIESLKKRHTGVYYCAAWGGSHSDTSERLESSSDHFVFVLEVNTVGVKVFSSGTRLYVTDSQKRAPETSVYSASSQKENGKDLLLCQANKMFPDIVKFTWEVQDQNGVKKELSNEEEVLEQRDETDGVQITSMVIVDKNKVKNNQFTCRVQHDDKPKDLIIPKDKTPAIQTPNSKTCPTQGPQKEIQQLPEKPLITGSSELSRSLYLFSVSYVMLLLKNLLYFCTISVLLYKRRSADKKTP
ncbi:uncharacterized protein LOC134311241 [Trichomycterus rosablanca]|uniref:uncharacterized protein LOC134311241 n=1 Tax=Trichomycterus rosablanca TaxID=2290929 RepID=UPI002F358191